MQRHDFSKIRLVFFDIDGTFVDDRKRLAPDTLEVMDALRARGVSLVPCTGRGFAGVTCLPGVVERSDYAICYDGALVFDLRGGTPVNLRTLPIEPDLHRAIMADATRRADGEGITSVVAFTEAEMHHFRVPAERLPGLGVWGAKPVAAEAAGLADLTGCLLALIYGGPTAIDALEAATRARAGDRLNLILYESDIMMNQKGLILKHHQTDKGDALAWLCARLGVPVASTLGLGDWFNDLGLIRRAGIGVAMKNAVAEVHALADLITEVDNNAFGAIDFLKRAFLSGAAVATAETPAGA